MFSSPMSKVQYCIRCRHGVSLTALRRGAAGAQSENSMISQSLDRQTLSDSEKWPSERISNLARTARFGRMMINSLRGSRALINLSWAITDSTLTDREGFFFFFRCPPDKVDDSLSRSRTDGFIIDHDDLIAWQQLPLRRTTYTHTQ